MPKLDLIELQRFVPAGLKYRLKPLYRKIFSNKLVVLLNPTWRCNYRFSCDRDSVLIRPVQIKSASEKPVARVQGTGQVR